MTAIVTLILGLTGFGILTRYLRNRDKLRLREMAHRERVLALEKGIAPTELPEPPVTDAWVEEPWTTRALDAGWDRRIALAIGLILLFGGVGIVVGLLALTQAPGVGREGREVAALAPLGIIPVMTGLGLILYHRVTAPRRRPASRELQVNGTR